MNLNIKSQIILKKLKENKFYEVISECEKLIKKFPDKSHLYNMCGLAYQRIKNIDVSINYFKKAIKLDPKDLGVQNNLANSYKHLYQYDLAENIFLDILNKKKDYLPAIANLAILKRKLNDFKNTVKLYEQAVIIQKNDPSLLSALASAYQSSGNFTKAKEISYKILKMYPKHVRSHKIISDLTSYSKSNENLGEMLNLYNNDDLATSDKSELSFAIAKAHEDLGDYEKSFKYFDQANKLKKKNKYNFSREEKLFRNIKFFFNSFELNNNKNNFDNRKIIFICGMPRSGTTLVEQILSSHNKVFGAGELNFLRQATTKFFILENKLDKQKIMDEINSSNNILNNEYFRLINYLKIKESTIIDKAPQNYIWIGFIKYFFPNAKIIHCYRNNKDVLLSIYKNNFGSNDMDWSYDPKDIVKYHKLYSDLMKFWKHKYNKFIYDLSYEKLVEDSENQIKKLLNHCDLEWDINCLNHHKYKKTAIQTVSISQARKPIYKSSVNLSEIYSKYLDNYFKLLNN